MKQDRNLHAEIYSLKPSFTENMVSLHDTSFIITNTERVVFWLK